MSKRLRGIGVLRSYIVIAQRWKFSHQKEPELLGIFEVLIMHWIPIAWYEGQICVTRPGVLSMCLMSPVRISQYLGTLYIPNGHKMRDSWNGGFKCEQT